jgi:transcriptional regulator with XRE-family HTH domain
MKSKMTIGQRIRCWREKRGLTQKKVARSMRYYERYSGGREITEAVVADWEAGRAQLTHGLVLSMSMALDVPACALFDDKTDEEVEAIQRYEHEPH